MAPPKLTPQQIKELFQPLFGQTIDRIERLSTGNKRLFWALRRKLAKELIYLERGTPAHRNRIKNLRREKQKNKCPICRKMLPKKDAILDRIEAYLGYTVKNTRLIHRECDL